ncbi:fimbria/pilus outer membrane usher protein [Andreprevotia chitinilytica]|uniref:fimbria/pilus outer membrane usher protein n=1 Tax=Andreprevotia chitinilytica TaxID=396808 RepID=UPI000690D2F3|nr:fimbria/pilus outer membrane usher protein [Andreprevotia chitinilytica]
MNTLRHPRPASRPRLISRLLLAATLALGLAGTGSAAELVLDAAPEGMTATAQLPTLPTDTASTAATTQTAAVHPAHKRFNARFLALGDSEDEAEQVSDTDLAALADGNVATPGVHRIEVMLNDERAGMHDILFRARAAAGAAPCVTPALLDKIGVNLSAFPALENVQPDECVEKIAMPATYVAYDADTQHLNLTVPNAMLKHVARGTVDSSQWQNGINAALFDYRVSGAKDFAASDSSVSSLQWYASLRSGLNVGPWRLRSNASLNRDSTGTKLQMQNIYARRAITSLKGQLTLGDAVTASDLFDSVPFRGVQLESDDSMQPDSLQGYAPVIRGIAQSHAKVEIRQNGFLVYSTYVPPGPFRIDDMYPTASNADMQVTITEADGRQHGFTQPYARIPSLLREGAWHYSATAGQLRIPGADRSPAFAEATVSRGFRNEFTLYGGAIASPIYQSAAFGVAKNMAVLGALSLDVTHARSQMADGHTESGQSLRFMYEKSLDSLGTEFRVAGFRYSTRGYHTFSDVVQPLNTDPFTLPTLNARDRIETNISQNLGGAGAMYASFTQQGYWNQGGKDRTLQLGYSNSYKKIPYSLNLSFDRRADGSSSRMISLNVSIPLGKEPTSANGNASYATASLVSGSDGLRESTGVSGTLLDNHALSYSVHADNSDTSGVSGGANLSYRSGIGEFGIAHNQSRTQSQTSVEAAGGMIIHGNGITLSQPLGETVALVAAPGAAGVGIENNTGVHTDARGYAVVPNLTPYRMNRVTLHTADLGRQLEVKTATRMIAPTRGAIVLTDFKVSTGRMLLNIKQDNGKPAPFGARIFAGVHDEVGMVGPDGQGFVSGAGNHGVLSVRWGKQLKNQCELNFDATVIHKSEDFPEIDAVCHPPKVGAVSTAAAPQNATPSKERVS